MGKDLTNSDYNRLIGEWLDKHLAESIDWHKAKRPSIPEEECEIYSQGFAVGWRDAISVLRLHGFLTRR